MSTEATEALEAPEEQTVYTIQEQKHYAKILAEELLVSRLKVQADDDRSEARESKNRYEKAAEELCQLIRGGAEPQMTLPGMEEGADWRELPLVELRLPDRIFDTLVEAKLTSIGELSDYVKEFVEFKSIKGIGEKSAEKICEAFVKFWEEHPEYAESIEEPDDREKEETSPDAAA